MFVLDGGEPQRGNPEDRLQASFVHWKRWWSRLIVDGRQPYADLAFLHSVPNGGHRDPKTARTLKWTGSEPGAADLQWLRAGHDGGEFLLLETKAPGGRQSKEQRAYEEFVRRTSRGRYFVWTDARDVARLVCTYAGWTAALGHPEIWSSTEQGVEHASWYL